MSSIPPMTQISEDVETRRAALTGADSVIKALSLTKIFKDFWMRDRARAVDHIDFEVRRGEVFGLLGPNGSGKSTTIKMILGLLRPTAGKVYVFGKRPDDVQVKKNIGYLPEETYLYRFLNARETLDYYARLFHIPANQRRRRIDMLLEMVGLEATQRRPIGEFSKGMQRRIGLAQALINDPHLLILDEPTTGLDPIGTRQIKDLIVELAARGKTILLCSHLLADVEDVCDRVAIMYGGKIRSHGTVDQLLTQEGSTTIQTGQLDAQTVQEIEALLNKHGRSLDKLDHPRRKLETLFLDIVEQAQSEGALTSGARAGGKIAQFLTESDDEQPEQVIDRLVGNELAAPLPSEEAPQEPAQPQEDTAVLSELTSPTAPEPAPQKPSAPAQEAETEDANRDLLDSLTKKDRKD